MLPVFDLISTHALSLTLSALALTRPSSKQRSPLFPKHFELPDPRLSGPQASSSKRIFLTMWNDLSPQERCSRPLSESRPDCAQLHNG